MSKNSGKTLMALNKFRGLVKMVVRLMFSQVVGFVIPIGSFVVQVNYIRCDAIPPHERRLYIT